MTNSILLVCMLLSPSGDADRIWDGLSATWGGPAGNFRVRCAFNLRVEQKDEALSDRYFPIALIPTDQGSRAEFRVDNQTKWIEDVAKRGDKYRNDYEFLMPDGRPGPRGWKLDSFYNGKYSWKYNYGKRLATQYEGADVVTRLTLGYYPDMIGLTWEPLSKDRTTAGGSGEPYRLDRLGSTGGYSIVGKEALGGRPCVVLDRPGLDRIWLAEDRGWAIVRRDWCWRVGGPIKRRITNADFQEIAPGAWIPRRASMEIFGHPSTRPGRRVGVLEAVVIEAEADVPDDWFEPHFPEGTEVYDVETGARSQFGREIAALDRTVASAARYGPAFRKAAWWELTRVHLLGFALAILTTSWALRRRSAHKGA